MAFLVAPVITGSGRPSMNLSGNSFVKTTVNTVNTAAVSKTIALYDAMKLKRYGLNKSAFEYAFKGYQYLLSKKKLGHHSVLSICDFSLSSRRKRLFIIDVDQQKLLINTYVAHGRKSGAEYARSFSNSPESHMSSLGFYVTGDPFVGQHGYSLKLEGMEKGWNDNALGRSIIMHPAKYVSEAYIRQRGFCGRSEGCPAIPQELDKAIIDSIRGGSCLFIFSPDIRYLYRSKLAAS